jgi:hypothetical protein
MKRPRSVAFRRRRSALYQLAQMQQGPDAKSASPVTRSSILLDAM